MSESGPYFHGWCDESGRVNAFVAALSALAMPGRRCTIHIQPLGLPDTWRSSISYDEAVELALSSFASGTSIHALLDVMTRSEASVWFSLMCKGETFAHRYPLGPLGASVADRIDFLIRRMDIVIGNGPRSTAVEAAVFSIQIQDNAEDVLLRLCAPDGGGQVTTGACTFFHPWGAPVETCATYHADVEMLARDLALSWVHLHDGNMTERMTGLSLDALAAHVEAAPRGARVGVASSVERLDEHLERDLAAKRSRETQPARPDLARKGSRPMLGGDEELTREQVLQALETSPATLLEALDAAAVPDDEWRAAEPLALEAIEAKEQGAPTLEIDVSTGKHRRFIEQHAPYHVRRLPNGGVLLATHPYRTLWQLWADALLLLGIRTDSGGST